MSQIQTNKCRVMQYWTVIIIRILHVPFDFLQYWMDICVYCVHFDFFDIF